MEKFALVSDHNNARIEYTTTCNCLETLNRFPCSCLYAFYIADINECTSNIHDCDSNAECENFYGGFSCACMEGFTGDGINFCDGELAS